MRGIKVIPQKHDWDCGVASIAMLLGESYGDVAKMVRDNITDPKLKRRGLILHQLELVIQLFGHNTERVYRKKDYLDGATGILGLNGGDCDPAGHWVVVKNGMIIDPSGGEVWKVEEYVKDAKCRPATLVKLVK